MDTKNLKKQIRQIEKEHKKLQKIINNDELFLLTVIQNAEKLMKDIDKRIENINLISAQLEDFITTEEWKGIIITSMFDPFQAYAKLQQIVNELQVLKQRIYEHITNTYKKVEEIKIKKTTDGEDDYSKQARQLDNNYFIAPNEKRE